MVKIAGSIPTLADKLRRLATLLDEFYEQERRPHSNFDIGLLNGVYRETAVALLEAGFNISHDTATALVNAAYFAGQ